MRSLLFTDLSKRQLKLCDFGFARGCAEGEKLKTQCGTPLYMAPELNRSGLYLGQPVDVWAVGCILFEALHNKPPFRGDTMQQLQMRIKRASHEALRKDLTPHAKALIAGCLTVDATARATAAAVAEHAWLLDEE